MLTERRVSRTSLVIFLGMHLELNSYVLRVCSTAGLGATFARPFFPKGSGAVVELEVATLTARSGRDRDDAGMIACSNVRLYWRFSSSFGGIRKYVQNHECHHRHQNRGAAKKSKDAKPAEAGAPYHDWPSRSSTGRSFSP